MTAIVVLLLMLSVFLSYRVIEDQKRIVELTRRVESMQVSLNRIETGSGADEADGGEQQVVRLGEASAGDEAEAYDGPLPLIRDYAEQGKSFITTLKALFTDQFVVADEGRFHFIDIDRGLRQYALDDDLIELTPEGVITYSGDEADISYGIDVSQHNDVIDWEALSAAEEKPDFIYIRLGIRGYESGRLVADTQVSANLIGARETGADVGVYFVTQAVNEEEAREEARFVLDTLSDNTVDLPIALDVEKIENYESAPRTMDLSREEYTRNVIAFADEMSKNGYETIIYGNGKTFMLMLDMTMLEDYDKWFADYVSEDDYKPYFPYDFSIWQYSSTGSVPGIRGKCDMNIRFVR